MRLSPGTIISGTLRPADLLCRFANVLALHQHAGNAGVISDAIQLALIPQELWTDEQFADADMLIDALAKRLDDLCPRGYYFGTHPGDGSDFGVWELEDDHYAEEEYEEEERELH